jgi:hypothetical protein
MRYELRDYTASMVMSVWRRAKRWPALPATRTQSRLRRNRRRNHWNCVQPSALPDIGPIVGTGIRRMTFLRQFTAGSPKVSTRRTSKSPSFSWIRFGKPVLPISLEGFSLR